MNYDPDNPMAEREGRPQTPEDAVRVDALVKCEYCAHLDFKIDSDKDTCPFGDKLEPCDKFHHLDWLADDMDCP